MSILQNSNAISAGGYDVNNSLRFRSSASAYLNRTFTTPTNNKIWTYSTWIKRGSLTTTQVLLATSSEELRYIADGGASGVVDSFQYNAGAGYGFRTNATYRDVSAWYHIVVSVDTTQATAANRARIYINGVEASTDGTYNISQNTNTQINSSVAHNIGRRTSGSLYFDGYQAETYFVDGQQLTPSSFGETDTTTGVWKPKAYTGTYGTNGFYLKFSDIATTSGSNAGLGKDFSGNSNYWTTNNISVTSGTTYDAMTDSPTLTSATVANYCVLNPTGNTYGGSPALTDGNLKTTASGANYYCALGTIGVSSGKYYWEVTLSGNDCFVGITAMDGNNYSAINPQNFNGSVSYYLYDGNKRIDGTVNSSYGATATNGDIIGVALDATNKTITFYKNNTSQGAIDYSSYGAGTKGTVNPFLLNYQNNSIVNFGQRPFTYTPPTGYVALNTYNLPTPTILQGNKYMDVTTYTGTGATRSLTGFNFQPDFTWFKTRNVANSNVLFDSIRGVGKELFSDLTNAEVTRADSLTAFNSNGVTLGADSGQGVNANTQTQVGWFWNAGSGTTSSNTQGSITSTVSVNTTAGFSVATFTTPSSGSYTVGHGLGVAPKFVITKYRSSGSNWDVWHGSLGGTQYLNLNTTSAVATNSAIFSSSPTSTVVNFGNNAAGGYNIIMYAWAEIAGFSKFGSYTGNGSADGPMIYCNFSPKFVLIKISSGASDYWIIFDTARNTYNLMNLSLFPNTSDADFTSTSAVIDTLSNGFKIRGTNGVINGNGYTYVYAAFASNPFKNSLAR